MIYFTDCFVMGTNPSTTGGGYTIVNEHNEVVEIKRIYKKGFTNNEGELLGVLRAIELSEIGSEIYTDSQCICFWVKNGKSKARKDLNDILKNAYSDMEKKNLTLVWIPREENLAGIYNEENGI